MRDKKYWLNEIKTMHPEEAMGLTEAMSEFNKQVKNFEPTIENIMKEVKIRK